VIVAGCAAAATIGASARRVWAGQGADLDTDGALWALLDDLARSARVSPARTRLDRLLAFAPADLSAYRRTDYDVVVRGLGREAAADALIGAPGAYRARLTMLLGADSDPARLHSEARAEIEDLQGRADVRLREVELAQGSVGARLRSLAADERFLYPDSDAGRGEAIADMNRWLERARSRLSAAFSDPPAELNGLAVRRMSAIDEAAARPGYRALQAADRAGPGGYWIDLHAIRTRPPWSLPSVAHHELLPGHLLQQAYAAAVQPHPLRLRYAAGYAEGWAIYAEQLADAQGAFRNDPLAEIGYLQWRLFRLGRVVVDTGLHDPARLP
jgi:uncharacterized protein (DUF885 family)